ATACSLPSHVVCSLELGERAQDRPEANQIGTVRAPPALTPLLQPRSPSLFVEESELRDAPEPALRHARREAQAHGITFGEPVRAPGQLGDVLLQAAQEVEVIA